MSRYFNSFMDNSSEALEHSCGTSPKAKAREKEYNHGYHQKHKDELAATNSYKQAGKSHDDARRYDELADKIDYRIRGYHQVGPTYVDPYGNSHTTYKFNKYSERLNANAEDALNNDKAKYKRMSMESEIKSGKYKNQGDRQKYSAEYGANSLLRRMKNPTAKDLVEFYLDTTVEKVKKSASKAKKYATKAMSTAEKSAKKYATKAMSTDEKSARKAIKSVVR